MYSRFWLDAVDELPDSILLSRAVMGAREKSGCIIRHMEVDLWFVQTHYSPKLMADAHANLT